MKKIISFIALILLIAAGSLNAQVHQYWEKVYDGSGLQDIEVAPSGRIYILDLGKFKYSDDFGESWQMHSMVGGANRFEIDDEGNLFCANTTVVYRCSAGDTVWEPMNFPPHYYNEIQINSAGIVFVNYGDTIFYSADDGLTYRIAYDSTFDGWGVTDSVSIFIVIDDFNAIKSYDLGVTWETFFLYHPFEIFTSSPSHIVVTRWEYAPNLKNLVISNDNGTSWQEGPSFTQLDWARIDPRTNQFIYSEFRYSPNWDLVIKMDNVTRESEYLGYFDVFRTHAGISNYHYVFGDGAIYRLSDTPPASDSLNYFPLHIGNKWQYVKEMIWNYGHTYELIESEVLDSTLIGGELYYEVSNFVYGYLVRYNVAENELYFRRFNNDYMYMDFKIGPHDVFYQTQPLNLGTVDRFQGAKGTINKFNKSIEYKGYQYYSPRSPSYYDVHDYEYFSPGIGVVRQLHQWELERHIKNLNEAVIFDETEEWIYYSNDYQPSVSFDTSFMDNDYLFSIDSLQLKHEFNDAYVYNADLYYFDSVWVEKAFIKGTDTITDGKVLLTPEGDYITHPCSFTVDSTLLLSGYYFAYAIHAADKALIPNMVRYPETGYFLNAEMTGINDNETGTVPAEFSLAQNYPNPFNPSTTISFGLPESGFVNLTVYNILGETVEILVNENLTPGRYNFTFNANDLPSGMYLYRLQAGDFIETKKMLFLK